MENKITMTDEELRQFEEFKQQQLEKEAEQKRKKAREDYANLVDDEVKNAIDMLQILSNQIKSVKKTVFDNFKTVLDMKAEVIGIKEGGQCSHTFTNSNSNMRLTLGMNTIDGYRDTVEDGICIVKQYIESLAKDENSKALVNAVLRLLSRDQAGNIKASRVLQLRKMADETGNKRFKEGVKIIEESYQPTTTKRYIRAEVKNSQNGWAIIPLGVSDIQ